MPAPSARERILDTAFRLFYARGIRAVGVDLIIAESGVAKATFYKHFPAKDELALAYLDRVDGIWRLEPGAPTRVAADFNPAEWDNWSLAGGRIAYLAREGETALVYVLALASGRRELAGRVGDVPWRSGMELLPDGRVVLAGGQKLDSDIVRFRMRR